MNGTSALISVMREFPSSLSSPYKNTSQWSSTQKRHHIKICPCQHTDFELLSSRTVRHKYLLFVNIMGLAIVKVKLFSRA